MSWQTWGNDEQLLFRHIAWSDQWPAKAWKCIVHSILPIAVPTFDYTIQEHCPHTHMHIYTHTLIFKQSTHTHLISVDPKVTNTQTCCTLHDESVLKSSACTQYLNQRRQIPWRSRKVMNYSLKWTHCLISTLTSCIDGTPNEKTHNNNISQHS